MASRASMQSHGLIHSMDGGITLGYQRGGASQWYSPRAEFLASTQLLVLAKLS